MMLFSSILILLSWCHQKFVSPAPKETKPVSVQQQIQRKPVRNEEDFLNNSLEMRKEIREQIEKQ
jgi:hypothetical protein